MSKRQLCAVVGLCFLAAGCAATPAAKPDRTNAANLLALVLPYKWVGLIDRDRLNEPSGIVYHRARRSLFAVGDEGDILELRTDGTAVNQTTLRKGTDLEAITCDPATGLLYIAVEGEEQILEVDPQTLTMLRQFTIDRTFRGQVRLRGGGEGVEGLTFVPQANHPEGGTFFMTNQAFSLSDPEDTSALCRLELPLRSGKGQGEKLIGRIVQYTAMPIIDMSALHYDAAGGHLFVACDADNVLLEMTLTGTILRTWALPGNDQEGLTVDDEDHLYIAQDSGGIIKLKWQR